VARSGDRATTLAADDVLEQFEAAWREGSEPSIEQHLARMPAAGPVRRLALQELIKLDIEYRWRKGSRPKCEDYLARWAEIGPVERLSEELIAEEYRVRQRWGDRPTHAEYAARFASHGGSLLETLSEIDAELDAEFQRYRPAADAANAVLHAEPVDPIVPLAYLLDKIGEHRLLQANQLEELNGELRQRFSEPRALGRELLVRNWLTPYQLNQLLQGRDRELVLGQYLLLERLGEGGTGWVFKARHQYMNRLVAVKILRRELLLDPEVLARFYREIQVVSQFSHPHVIHAYDAGPIDERHVLVMEYAPGIDLARLVKRSGPLPVEQAADYVRQAALGLQHIHERGLVHRDIKPSNLLVASGKGLGAREVAGGDQGLGAREDKSALATSHQPLATLELATSHQPLATVKILDLGLSRLGRVERRLGAINNSMGASSGRLTPQGAMVVGTPDYLAPEQALDFHKADIRADVYSLGCTFFYLLTGQPPFPGGSLVKKLMRHQQAEPPALDGFRPDVPAEVAAIVQKMLAKEPGDRFQQPAEVGAALLGAVPSLAANTPAEAIPETVSSALSPTLPDTEAGPGRGVRRVAQRRRRPIAWAAMGLGLVAAAVVTAIALGLASGKPPSRPASKRLEIVRIAPIDTLYSTGVGGHGAPLKDGEVDPHWKIVAAPPGAIPGWAYATLNKWPVGNPWVANTFRSRWISPQADESAGDAPGKYTYQTTFHLKGFDPNSAHISAKVAADNHVIDVRLNGRSLGLKASGYLAFSTLEIAGPFMPGINTLEFIVLNDPDENTGGANPSGLRVELTGSGSVLAQTASVGLN
jgi:serine/threonine-protein kinase